ncbi:MAG: 6-phosphofructokinase [Bradymonadaceae bacterium]
MDRVAIVTSGGDATGMNSAVRAATKLLRARDTEVVGVESGYRGLVEGRFRELALPDVEDIQRHGGTILGSARSPAFREASGRERALEELQRADVDGLIVVGGNGSLTGLQKLLADDQPGPSSPAAVGIPASIDHDIGYTGTAIGVDTALNTIVEAADKIADTARAFDRTFIVEVMGRKSGYLAMTSGIAASADLVAFPEAEADADELVDAVVETATTAAARQDRSGAALAIVAEGVDVATEDLKARVDRRLGEIADEGGPSIDTRVTVLGHVVRGGSPSGFDRLLGSRLARVAVEALADGRTGEMVGWMLPGEPPDAARRSPADPYCWLVDLDAVIAETRRMLEGESQLVEWRARVFEEIRDVLML